MFDLSDDVRDNKLPHLGIKIEDKKPGVPAVWKFVDKDILIKEIEDKKAEKLAKEKAKAEKAALELKKKSTQGIDYFRVFEADKWAEISDETGMPTK
jgi:hypothetical protein